MISVAWKREILSAVTKSSSFIMHKSVLYILEFCFKEYHLEKRDSFFIGLEVSIVKTYYQESTIC